MLLHNVHGILYGILCFLLVTMACASYAYHVNTKRSEDDPKKRKYHPIGILFAPITLPLLVLSLATLFVLRVLLYGVLIIGFVIGLLVLRKPFLLAAIHKLIMKIGEALLQASAFLVGIMLRLFSYQPDRTKIPASQQGVMKVF